MKNRELAKNGRQALRVAVAAVISCSPGFGQRLLGSVVIQNADLAILEAGEQRQDLPCEVRPFAPELGLDMRFRAGYGVTLPVEELPQDGGRLRVLFRLTPLDAGAGEYYFSDRIILAPIEEGTKGLLAINGEFALGRGRYRVSWMMGDRRGKICSTTWESVAKLDGAEEELALTLPPNTAAQRVVDPFEDQSPVQPPDDGPRLHVRVLVNLSPPDPAQSSLRDRDLRAIASILRGISRQPRIGRYSVVAFTLTPQQVVYSAENRIGIDFPALGKTVKKIEPGTVDFRQLQDPDSESRFLATLLTERSADQPQPDALIIVGHKLMADKSVPRELLLQAGSPTCPVFYLHYAESPAWNPWRDSISAAVRVLRGLEYSISAPRDLSKAMREMMFQLGSRNSKSAP